MVQTITFTGKKIPIAVLTFIFLTLAAAPPAVFGQIPWKCAIATTPFEGRCDHQILGYDNKLWIFPGSSNKKTNRDDIWHTTDGKNWTCAVKTAPFSTRCYYSALSFNGYMWIIAGGDYC